jgi:hypothetical protein
MTDIDTVTTSNGLRLNGREWAGLALFAAALVLGLPRVWPAVERFEPEADYRVPYDISNDYWHFDRYVRAAAERSEVLLFGDSVVWGQYVRPRETLAHHLNAAAGRERFANLGLDGAHPAALEGLLERCSGSLSGRKVVLHFNPLWLSSARHDLSAAEEFRFNHPPLVPQFVDRPPCYREETSKRIGLVVDRHLPFGAWTKHLQSAYFKGTNVPAWTLDHPYRNPLAAVTAALPAPDDKLRHEPISWTARGIAPQEFPWVGLEASYQWRSFRRAVEALKRNGNGLFVVVGPFNEHLIAPSAAGGYRAIKEGVERWLSENGVPHAAPPPLPSELYADSSHPLAAGYQQLARQLLEHAFLK